MLYVLGFCKSLLSIQSLTKDLNCLIYFDEHGFYAKDKKSGMILLHGSSSGGLYHLVNDLLIKCSCYASGVAPTVLPILNFFLSHVSVDCHASTLPSVIRVL